MKKNIKEAVITVIVLIGVFSFSWFGLGASQWGTRSIQDKAITGTKIADNAVSETNLTQALRDKVNAGGGGSVVIEEGAIAETMLSQTAREVGVSVSFFGIDDETAIDTTISYDVRIPYSCDVLSCSVLSDSGTAVFDIGKSTFGSYPSVSSICGDSKPSVTAGASSEDTTLSGWTKEINKGDCIRFSVMSATMSKATVNLLLRRK